MQFADIVFLFTACCILAWLAERLTLAVYFRKFSFSFLFGVFTPYYGLIYLLIILFLKPLADKNILFFLPAAFVVVILARLIFHRLLDYLFQVQLRRDKFYFVLIYAVIAALMCTAAYYIIQPLVLRLTSGGSPEVIHFTALFMVVLFIAFAIFALSIYVSLKQKIEYVQEISKELAEVSWFVPGRPEQSIENFDSLSAEIKAAIPPKTRDTLDDILNYTQQIRSIRKRFPLLNNFIDISEPDEEEILSIKDFFSDLKKAFRALFYKQERDQDDVDRRSFAAGLNLYKMIWIFFIASILGFVVESLYSIVQHGHIESRQGLIYGPFSQIYGIGAILLTLALYRIRHMRAIWIFIASAVIGGLFEAGASYIQEMIFGTVSWDYSDKPFPLLGGRTCLTYMVFWGLLGVFFISYVYPKMSAFVEKIPNRMGKVLSWGIVAFFIFDVFISAAAVIRMDRRASGIKAENEFAVFLDEHYTDDFLKKIYPNMVKRK